MATRKDIERSIEEEREIDYSLPAISQRDYDAAMLYDAMNDRWNKAPDDWGVAMMSVRLLCKRYSLDTVLATLEHEGAPFIAEKCREEMLIRHNFFVRMLAQYPMEEEGQAEKAAEEMANDLAVFDSVRSVMNLLRFLDRVLQREIMLRIGSTVH